MIRIIAPALAAVLGLLVFGCNPVKEWVDVTERYGDYTTKIVEIAKTASEQMWENDCEKYSNCELDTKTCKLYHDDARHDPLQTCVNCDSTGKGEVTLIGYQECDDMDDASTCDVLTTSDSEFLQDSQTGVWYENNWKTFYELGEGSCSIKYGPDDTFWYLCPLYLEEKLYGLVQENYCTGWYWKENGNNYKMFNNPQHVFGQEIQWPANPGYAKFNKYFSAKIYFKNAARNLESYWTYTDDQVYLTYLNPQKTMYIGLNDKGQIVRLSETKE